MPEATHNPVSGARAGIAGLPEIKGFLETSFLDWRGRIAAVLFLPGCNFSCPFCHNYTLVTDPDAFETHPTHHVLGRLRNFVGWIDGVVISGGEPTLHPGLPLLIKAIKAEGFAIKLDTNGYKPETVRALVESGDVDMVAMDVKAPLEELAYRRATGRAVDVERVRQSIDFLKSCGIDHEFRSTIIPAWHGETELAQMGEAVRGCRAWTLQAMNPETAWNRQALGQGGIYTSEDITRLQAEVAAAYIGG